MATKQAHPSDSQTGKLASTETASNAGLWWLGCAILITTVLLSTVQSILYFVFKAPKKMTYKVFIYTGGKMNSSLTLVDSNQQTTDKILVKGKQKEIIVDVSVTKNFGKIVLVKLEGNSSPWFCEQIRVKAPTGKFFEFPFYRWIKESEQIIREGSARLPQDETGWLKTEREEELKSRKTTFSWIKWRPGFPQILKLCDRDLDFQFDQNKSSHFKWNGGKVFLGEWWDSIKGSLEPWKHIDHFKQILKSYTLDNTLLETVIDNWGTDYMFGYQFLNGCNPVMISKCVELPDNFPVTHEMVEGSLQRGLTLEEEIKEGNIYIANYEILEGLEARESNYVTAPLCLLYNNRLNQIVPIAIQLSQRPGEDSPIFLPDDNEYDWILAKMWVKSADFNVHKMVTHFLKTHLISEVFEAALHRQLSMAHPVYKLLMPHVRFTIAINTNARNRLISDNGSKITSLSENGIDELVKRAKETLTYKSLCFPEAIKARGMEDAPRYYYRDDGMKIWETINCFVSDVVKIYYDSDEAVLKDVEIQEFVKDVSRRGIQTKSDEFPKSLTSREELAEYLTVVIFTASAQHAAVNFGQFEWFGWIPNSPSTMRKPPHKKKDADESYIMETLPCRSLSTSAVGTVWTLTQFEKNERFLGMYPDMYFTEQPVKEAIQMFRKKLADLTDQIKSRNKTITMQYCYLSPDQIPNSVAI